MHVADNRHVKAKFQTALRLLFPPRCVACGALVESDFALCADCWLEVTFLGGDVCDACGAPVIDGASEISPLCDSCLYDRPPWSKGRAAFMYGGVGRSLVLALKHGDRTDIVRPAAKWLAGAAQPLLKPNTLVAPVPLHRWRYLRRRYNQAALVAEAVARHLSLPYCPDLLLRVRGLGSLEGLGAAARRQKLSGAICANPKHAEMLHKASVLLVDDVLTTGATLKAATEACLNANAKDVCVATLARVAKDT
nr:ComF family protein [Shimia sp. R11_0]